MHTTPSLCLLHWWQTVGWDFNNKADCTHLSLTSNLCPPTPPTPTSLEKFLGHQAYSYGQLLSITFTSETTELLPDHVTLLLQGSGVTLSADLSPQPVLDHDRGLTPRHSFIVRYKDAGMGLSVYESVGCFFSFFFTGELESLWKIPKRSPDHVQKNGYRDVCFSLCIYTSPCCLACSLLQYI